MVANFIDMCSLLDFVPGEPSVSWQVSVDAVGSLLIQLKTNIAYGHDDANTRFLGVWRSVSAIARVYFKIQRASFLQVALHLIILTILAWRLYQLPFSTLVVCNKCPYLAARYLSIIQAFLLHWLSCLLLLLVYVWLLLRSSHFIQSLLHHGTFISRLLWLRCCGFRESVRLETIAKFIS